VVDGRIIRAGLERWGIMLADRAQPGIFGQKRVLMVPGLNHNGLAGALERRGRRPTLRRSLHLLRPAGGARHRRAPDAGQAAARRSTS
jgi:hypothetical protein